MLSNGCSTSLTWQHDWLGWSFVYLIWFQRYTKIENQSPSFRRNMATWNKFNRQDTTLKRSPGATGVFSPADRPPQGQNAQQFGRIILCAWKLWRHHRRATAHSNAKSSNWASKCYLYILRRSPIFAKDPQAASSRQHMPRRRADRQASRIRLLLWLWRPPFKDSTNWWRPSNVCPHHITCLHFVFFSFTHTGRTPKKETWVQHDAPTFLGGIWRVMNTPHIYTNFNHAPRMDLRWRKSRSFSSSQWQDSLVLWQMIF